MFNSAIKRSDVNKGSTCEEVVRFAALSSVLGLMGMQGRMGWRETEWQTGNSGSGGALVIRLRPLTSFGTGADHGGCRWINQGHVDALRAVLWTDDLGQAFGPRLAQQLTFKTKRRVYWQCSLNHRSFLYCQSWITSAFVWISFCDSILCWVLFTWLPINSSLSPAAALLRLQLSLHFTINAS